MFKEGTSHTDELIGKVALDLMAIRTSHAIFIVLQEMDFPVIRRKEDVIGQREAARKLLTTLV